MPAVSLDDPAVYEALDPHGLLGRIESLPAQAEQAWAAAGALDLPSPYAETTRVAVLGMGGSGIGGLLLRALALERGTRTPIDIVRTYRLPAYVGANTLVIASSNSGNTEETVQAFEGALAAGARCVAITTGGRLAELAREHAVPLLRVDWRHEPRAALGWSFAAPLRICARLGAVDQDDGELRGALAAMGELAATVGRDIPERANAAKQLARRLHGRLPVFVGADAFVPVAYRWRTQVNENAKSWAIADELPEMNHNAHAGYGLPQRVVPLLHVVLLRHAGAHPHTARRFAATADRMRRDGVSAEIVGVDGPSLLAQVLRGGLLGDFVSYYLGLLNGVPPSPVEPLDELKELLARQAGG
jgi:glucose/mannose-6-phosphate isomerase